MYCYIVRLVSRILVMIGGDGLGWNPEVFFYNWYWLDTGCHVYLA